MHRPIAAALLLLAGCSEYDIIDFEEVDVFFQNPAEEVDILMVVDNSCSMGPYQLALGANFNQFITYFIDANVDYHIGVTTTTIQRPEYTSLIPSCTQADLDEIPNAGHLAQATVIDNNTSGAASLFQDLVNVGTCGSGFEMGLEAAMVALSPPVLATANIGFLREEASLSIILVSDEEDNSPDPVNEYINTYFGVKGHRERDIFNASALVVTDISGCFNAAGSTLGTRYVDVAEQTHGVIGNLCSQDFSQIVTDLSLNASRLRDTFFLSQEPNPLTLQVTVDNEVWSCEEGMYTYDRVEDQGVPRPAIIFDRTAMPQPGQQISVRYDQGDGDPALFCTEVSE
ncbi:MAG: hypothetical protein JRI25_16600 [Deltaproteobacteria bacterium]|nr:hypothetical protein [Deltaproteobacteria bacterium]